MKLESITVAVRNTIELIGQHPLVTGVMVIIGISGFLFSIFTYEEGRKGTIESAQRVERTLDATISVGENVQAISDATYSACAKAPCWTLNDFVNKDTIGRPKDLIDAKVAPAMRKLKGQFLYDFDGCVVRVEYRDDAVSYFSANLFKHVEVDGPKDKWGFQPTVVKPCEFSMRNLFNFDQNLKISSNEKLTVADVMNILEPSDNCNGCSLPDLNFSSSCIDCGNYADPYLEFMERGAHAQMWVNSFFTTSFDPVEDDDIGTRGYEVWRDFKEKMRSYIGPDAFIVEANQLCDRDIYPDIKNILSQSQIRAVGLGVGPRTWTDNLFCKWWE